MAKILIVIPLLLVLLTLASCGGNGTIQEQEQQPTTQSITEETTPEDTTINEDIINNEDITTDSEEPENDSYPTYPIYDAPTGQTIEALSATIVAAGTFWEDWWALRGPFSRDNIEDIMWLYWEEYPHHPLSQGFSRLLPSSGFTGLSDIESYLSRYYTETWIHERVISENDVFDEAHATMLRLTIFANIFAEYDGALYTHTLHRGGNTNRPNWAAATHTIIGQDNIRTIVETTVPIQPWIVTHRSWRVPRESIYQFIFIDGRIDEMLHLEDIYDIIPPPVFNDMAVSPPHMQLLAHALSDFFADAEPLYGMEMENDIHAILVDLDGNGTPGVIASKWTTAENYGWNPYGHPRFVQMLFYIYADQLNYSQIFSMAVAAPSRRLVRLDGANGQGMTQNVYSLLGFSDGELVPVKSIIAIEIFNLPCGYGVSGENRYYVVHNPESNLHMGEIDWERSIPITYVEFMEFAAQYGLLSIFNNSNILEIPCEADLFVLAP